MRRKLLLVLGIVVGMAGIWAVTPSRPLAAQEAKAPAAAAKPQQPPYSEKEVLDLLKHSKKHPETVMPEISARGVDFDVTPQIEEALRKAGADDGTVDTIKQNGPTARAARQAQGAAAGPVISPEESKAYHDISIELDPDKAIQLAKDFATKYPTSSLLANVYVFEGAAYEQKNDPTHAVEYAEKGVQLKPDDIAALLMVATDLPQPQMIQGSDAEKTKKLAEAETDAQTALKIIDQIPKQANETDDAYQKRKADITSNVHSSLGIIHLERANMSLGAPDKDELAKAEQEYKTALSMESQPNPSDYYRLGEVYRAEDKISEAIDAFTKSGDAAGPGSPLKAYADAQVAALQKVKPQAPPPPAKP